MLRCKKGFSFSNYLKFLSVSSTGICRLQLMKTPCSLTSLLQIWNPLAIVFIGKVNQPKLYCIDEAVVVIVVWIDGRLCPSNPLWKRDPATASLHSICTVNVNPELKDVVQDVCAVSVVVLIQALPLNGGYE